MGVHGLTPFLKKNFPSVLKSLPGRFRDIRGKTVAIDGTLITQRFHFAQLPHKYKHVLGWYRLLTELRNNEINAICIFDGDHRTVAKLQEAERRRLARRLVTDRGNLETGRLHRLKSVKAILENLHSLQPKRPSELIVPETVLQDRFDTLTLGGLDDDKKEPFEEVESNKLVTMDSESSGDAQKTSLVSSVTDRLPSKPTQNAGEDKAGPNVELTSDSEEKTHSFNEPSTSPVASPTPPAPTTIPNSSSEDVHVEEKEIVAPPPKTAEKDVTTVVPLNILREPSHPGSVEIGDHVKVPTPESPKPDKSSHREEKAKESYEVDGRKTLLDSVVLPSKPPEQEDQKKVSVETETESKIKTSAERPLSTTTLGDYEELCRKLVDWHTDFLQYKQLAQQGAVSQSTIPDDTSYAETPILMPSHTADDGVQESKLQVSLTKEEESVWTDLNAWRTSGMLNYSAIDLSGLIEKSQILSDSYQRRSNTPTSTTYEECKMIIKAMGMPCITCDGPYEAEALASSLVQNGKADFVASEDTDVLVYGAKLLRNVTSGDKDLVSLSGAEVQDALALHGPSYVDFALLLGTDFSPRLRSLGPTRALRFITAHGSIENVIKEETKYTPIDVDAYLAQVRLAREVFTTLPPVPQDEELKASETDRESVTELLGQFKLMRAAFEHDWDPRIPLAGNYFQDSPTLGGELYEYTPEGSESI